VDEFGLDPKKVKRVFVGPTIRDQYRDLPPQPDGPFTVLYFGTYIPLHGVNTILHAAHKLGDQTNIRFLMVGSGQNKEEAVRLKNELGLQNIEFSDWISTDRLGSLIRSCDLSLGVFGTTEKTFRVIPSKVFDICAAAVPFITADTPALREAFIHKENAWLVPAGDPGALADAIKELEDNRELRKKIAEGAHMLAWSSFSVEEIGRELVRVIEARGREGERANGR
jgi:glycosyltransferase involved in cell wall biosynthesis